MTNFLISAIQDALIVIVFFLPCCVRSMNNHSLFAFTKIDKKSPDNIEDSCLTINNSTPGTLYFGISLFINNTSKNATCPSKNVELKNIRKDIIRDKHDRPLCRTTLTVSINSILCERTVVDLNFLCQENFTQSRYFRECREVSYGENRTNKDEEKAISMSALPAPVIGNRGPVYNIPTVQCRLNPNASDSLTTKRQDTITVNVKEALQSIYHVLQEEEEELQADSESVDTIILEQITLNKRLEKESDINDGDSQKEYFIIEASNERVKEKREPIARV